MKIIIVLTPETRIVIFIFFLLGVSITSGFNDFVKSKLVFVESALTTDAFVVFFLCIFLQNKRECLYHTTFKNHLKCVF